MSFREKLHGRSFVCLVVACVLALIVGASIGVGIYSAVGCKKDAAATATLATPKDKERVRLLWHEKLLDEMKADNIKNELQYEIYFFHATLI